MGETIAFVVGWEHAGWVRRVPHDGIEVDNAIECVAVADPFINGHPLGLLVFVVKTFERRSLEGDPNGVSVAPMIRNPWSRARAINCS